MKKLFFTSVVLLFAASLNAQFVLDYLKAADNYFEKGDYFSAAQYYEKYFDKDKTGKKEEYKPYAPQNGSKKTAPAVTNREQAIYRLAESYRLLNYPAKAAPYYQEAMAMDPAKFPLAPYHHATMLRALEMYAEAEQGFTSFLATYTADDQYRKGAEREIKNLRFIQEQLRKKDLKYFTVNKAPGMLNSMGASYAPTWLNASTLLFTSTRPLDSTDKKVQYTNRLYHAMFSEGNLTNVNATNLPQGKDVHQGVAAATPNGTTLFFTRWTVGSNKQKTAALYSSKLSGENWSDPVMLGTSINVSGSNTQQPAVTPDGKYLLFSSDRAGGFGGFDLWYAELDANGNPGTPSNLGRTINSEGDDQAPFYHEASRSLVFSSNGRVGMGGYDFYQSKGTIGSFEEPVNLGYPVNSVKDDIYFSSRGTAKNMLEDVMLSSDRDAACCLELFYLKKIRPLRQITGRIVSCDPSKPLTGATVTVVDASNNTLYTQAVSGNGNYSLAMEDYLPVTIKAEASGFISNSVNVAPPADMEQESMVYPELCLVPVPPQVNETFVVQNVYYDFNKSELKAESFPALDEIVRMLETYPNMKIELSAHTDSKGSNSYNQKLSEARAKSAVAYLISKGIDAARLTFKGYGETMPIAPNTNDDGSDNPEGREKNRRTEFKVLEN